MLSANGSVSTWSGSRWLCQFEYGIVRFAPECLPLFVDFLLLRMMKPWKNIIWVTIAGMIAFASCQTSLFSSFSYEDVNEQRAVEQTNFEDSAKVFFATYPNPYTDKEFLWFAVFVEGPVEMRVHDLESDALQSTYRFEKQDTPVHTIALHPKPEHLVKCVLFVNGRMKCAKVYPDWQPIPYPQFKTQYTIDGQ